MSGTRLVAEPGTKLVVIPPAGEQRTVFDRELASRGVKQTPSVRLMLVGQEGRNISCEVVLFQGKNHFVIRVDESLRMVTCPHCVNNVIVEKDNNSCPFCSKPLK